MIELTEVIDPYAYRYETRKTLVLLDNLTHVSQVAGMHNRAQTELVFTNGSKIYVAEHIDVVERQVRDYAEKAQKERVAAMVKAEVESLLPEMADKAWRYDESST